MSRTADELCELLCLDGHVSQCPHHHEGKKPMKILKPVSCEYGILMLVDPETGDTYSLNEKELATTAPDVLEALADRCKNIAINLHSATWAGSSARAADSIMEVASQLRDMVPTEAAPKPRSHILEADVYPNVCGICGHRWDAGGLFPKQDAPCPSCGMGGPQEQDGEDEPLVRNPKYVQGAGPRHPAFMEPCCNKEDRGMSSRRRCKNCGAPYSGRTEPADREDLRGSKNDNQDDR